MPKTPILQEFLRTGVLQRVSDIAKKLDAALSFHECDKDFWASSYQYSRQVWKDCFRDRPQILQRSLVAWTDGLEACSSTELADFLILDLLPKWLARAVSTRDCHDEETCIRFVQRCVFHGSLDSNPNSFSVILALKLCDYGRIGVEAERAAAEALFMKRQ